MEIMEIEDATMFRDPNADNVTLVVEEREIVVSKVVSYLLFGCFCLVLESFVVIVIYFL